MRQTIIDVVPISRNGEIVYEMIRGLGAVTQANLQSATNLVGAATATLPNKPVSYQSDFSKVANTCGTIAGLVAVIPGIGWVAAAVCGVVAGVCLLLGKLFANSKTKKAIAERKQFEVLNAQIKFENQQLDLKYIEGSNAIRDLRAAFGAVDGVALYGLGSKKSSAEAALENEKELNEALTKEQAAKAQLLMSVVDEFNKLMKAKFELADVNKLNTTLMWILGGGAVVLAGFLAYQNRTEIKKQLSK